MVISWKFAQGPGAQFAFFLLGHHFCLRLTLRTFFFLHGAGGGGGGWGLCWSLAASLKMTSADWMINSLTIFKDLEKVLQGHALSAAGA